MPITAEKAETDFAGASCKGHQHDVHDANAVEQQAHRSTKFRMT